MNDRPVAGIVSDCLTNIHDSSFSRNDKIAHLYFALNAGEKSAVLRTLREWPNKEKFFPWEVFLATLLCAGEKLSDDEFSELISYLSVHSKKLPMSPQYIKLNKNFALKVREYQDSLNYESNRKIKLLWDKLYFIQGKDLVEEEIKVLELLKVYDPHNEELKTHIERVDKKAALNVFKSPKKTSYEEDYNSYLQSDLSKDDIIFCQNIFDTIKESTTKGSGVYFDFAILFYQLEAYSFALKSIELSPNCLKKDWFLLELLFLSKRYFECIDLADRLYQTYKNRPDIQFASLYQKAQALWVIGSKGEALDLMQAIVNARPEYRSAYEILHSWKDKIIS